MGNLSMFITYTGENVGFVHYKRSLMAANTKCSRGKKTENEERK
jgi:hypothetical protein